MQCPSCAFENIPGQASCGRCGTRLDLRSADIDVAPPRAGKGTKTLRAIVPRRGFYRMRDELSDAVRGAADHLEHDAFIPLPEPGLAVRLLVPGWAHAYQGRATRGRLFLAAYLALGAIGMLNWGSPLGSMALGLMFSVHVSSALDALMSQGRVRFPAMMATTAIVMVLLGVAYAPAGWTLSHVAAIREFAREDGLFRRGDRLVVNEWAFALQDPRPGQLVLFQPQIPGRIEAGAAMHMVFVQEENELIDRVLAGPGDAVTWDRKADELTVNGQPTSWRPLRPERLPERLDIRVPHGCYLVLPTTSDILDSHSSSQVWAEAGRVARDRIVAGAYLRLPLSRLWWLR
jgi:signal peptidase I